MTGDVVRRSALGLAFEVRDADARLQELLAGFTSIPDGPGTVVRYEYVAPAGEAFGEILVDGIGLGLDRSTHGLYAELLRDLSARAVADWDGPVIHGCALTRADDVVLLCGRSGAGKSTLTATLARRGWSLLAEDLCAVDAMGRIQPFNRPIGLTRQSLDALALPFADGLSPLHKRLTLPSELSSRFHDEPAAPTLILMLDAEPSYSGPIAAARVVRLMLEQEALAVRSGADLRSIARLIESSAALEIAYPSEVPMDVILQLDAVPQPWRVDERGGVALLHVSRESFVLRDGGSVSHLDPIATMVADLLADHSSPEGIADRLAVDLSLVRSVADLLSPP